MFNNLLVDDSAADRRLIKGLLSKHTHFEIDTADNGVVALERMTVKLPDLVVTDMQMPEMDGLHLVDSIRSRYPLVPVVLITAEGSEDLASRALQRGAAGYVPKSRCDELLHDTIEHVIELTRTESSFEQIIDCATLCEFDFSFKNDFALIAPLLELAQRMTAVLGVCDAAGCVQVSVALEHAILNAIYHGNLENGCATKENESELKARLDQAPYKDRRVHIEMRITRDEARFVVRDEGPGFNVKEIADNGRKLALSGEAGRGLFLMWAFMDRVAFDKKGNTVTMTKRRVAPVPSDPAKSTPEKPPAALGNLRPADGSAPHRLTKMRMTIGRDASCDIVIRSSSISLHHCVLYNYQGWWYVRDLKSKNGIRINHVSFTEHVLRPGTLLSVGKYDFKIEYEPYTMGADGLEPPPDPF